MNFKKTIALLLAACMLLGLLAACGSSEPTPTEAAPTESVAPTDATEPSEGSGVTTLKNYAILEASPHDENMAAVIAYDADGNPALTNGVLQFPYWLQFFSFMNQYGMYAEIFGLDPNAPLAGQMSMAEDMTWEQYFLDGATTDFAKQYALYRAALDNNHALTAEEQATLDDILDPNGSIATGAADAGFDSVEAYMQSNFGPGVDLQDYYDYVKIYLTANSYYATLTEQANAADEAALSAFFDEHTAYFATTAIRKVNNVSVRHILISPEQDETTGEATDAAWAAAEKSANAILTLWQENPTEENFADLANEHSSDPGSNTTGGLYADFDTATMVAEFTDWSFDPARVYGDTGIVKTSYGYHIMFYVGPTETKGWVELVRSHMADALLYDITAAYPVTFDFAQVRIYDLVTMMANEEPAQATEELPSEEAVILPEDTFAP